MTTTRIKTLTSVVAVFKVDHGNRETPVALITYDDHSTMTNLTVYSASSSQQEHVCPTFVSKPAEL